MDNYIVKPYVPNKDKIKSPLRYPGGKFYALKHIMPYIECVEHDEYREPFFGGGSVFFAKSKAQYNIINDLEKEIVNFYKVITIPSLRSQLIKMLESETATKQRHFEVKSMDVSTELERAFKTYYLNRTSYSGIINSPAWGYAEGKSSPPSNWGKFIEQAAKKLVDCEIYSSDYKDILLMPAKGEKVLIYLDPPYYHADQKRAYTKPFEIEDHERLANDLKGLPYMFCLSYDDCTEIRELYSWANIYDVSWLYNTANKSGEKRKPCQELIITNYNATHN